MSEQAEKQAKTRRVEITGHSQITVNKKWVAAIVLILLVFTGVVGWMYMVAATSRPPTVKTGGY
jgi:hypothetical protein